MDELNGVRAPMQLSRVVDLAEPEDATAARMAGHLSTSGCEEAPDEGLESSGSVTPSSKPIQSRQRGHSRLVRINSILVYRMAVMEMVDRAGGRPVYMVDYFTSAITPEYLESLLEEFQIPGNVELVVPGSNNLPSRPPPGHVTLLVEFFRAGLRLPFHPFLRRALQRLNIAPVQLNANAYHILISYFVLWAKYFYAELPFNVLQSLYRMKTTFSLTGSYYFQGWQGTFIVGYPDSDNNYKHLWFYSTGK